MKHFKTILITSTVLTALLLSFPQSLKAQGTLEDYRRAEKFIHFNVEDLIYNLRVDPHWIGESSEFWFRKENPDGYRYRIVIPGSRTSRPAFDHEKLARSLGQEMKREVSPDSLPFNRFRFDDDRQSLLFSTDTTRWVCDLSDYKLTKRPPEKFGKHESLSPDSGFVAFIKDYNLYVASTHTSDTTQLTFDGKDQYDYAASDSWYRIKDETVEKQAYDPSIYVDWSPDSRKLITHRLDRRDVGKLYMYQSMPEEGMAAKSWSYERPLPGDDGVKRYEYFVFDVHEGTKTKVDIPPFATFLSSVGPLWTGNSKNIWLGRFNRGYKSIDLFSIDPESGRSQTIVHDSSETMVEYQMINCKVLEQGEKILWTSERSGYNHIYLFENGGSKVTQVTSGNYVVRDMVHVDETSGTIWFVAGGKEKSRDPYYRHLYRVNFDGTGLQLLTPENADHEVQVSPDGRYFVDNYSRVDLKPHSIIRRMRDGQKVMDVQEANIQRLEALGWQPPRMFRVKARDGHTDLYGVLYLPTNLDPDQSYPVIDATYTGPQAVYAPKTFSDALHDSRLPLAELGFAVMTVDGMGTAMRSKAFHDVSYKNLGDIGAPDHIGAIRQLKETYPFLDTNNVGIYGHSAGGYDAAHALLIKPDFYKVGVASAGNHDHRMAKAWWPEQYMGMPDEHYSNQSNLTLAGNLKGKLLLVHGDMDNNVNPASTLRLAGELIKHNKDFDLLIIPNKDHGGLYSNTYFIRKRWDYFVRHLMHKDPPYEYSIQKDNQ